MSTKNKILLHRFIMQAPKGMLVDHINRNTLDCRRSNLRLVNQSQNSQNMRITGRKNGSGYKNVRWIERYQRWRVAASFQGKDCYGGHYQELEEAKAAAQELRRTLHTHSPENSLK